jgi:putative PIN family toxin of toxin-antitoxin system
LVSAFVARGLCSDLFRIIVTEHELIISDYVLHELATVLEQKINLPSNQIDDIIKYLKTFSVIKNHTPTVDIQLRDKDDIPILSAALNSGAKYLITGDKDLLEVNKIYNIKIIDPKQFLRIIKLK